jgi:hypothetical protein
MSALWVVALWIIALFALAAVGAVAIWIVVDAWLDVDRTPKPLPRGPHLAD